MDKEIEIHSALRDRDSQLCQKSKYWLENLISFIGDIVLGMQATTHGKIVY